MTDDEAIKHYIKRTLYYTKKFVKEQDREEYEKRISWLINGTYYSGKASKEEWRTI